MTTENRRFRTPRVFLAALGLALALPLSAAASTTTAVGFFSTAPASVDATANDVAVMYLDMTATDGTATLSYFQLSVFGDVAPGPLKADMWRDNGDLQFSPASDQRISSVSFQAVGGGFPPAAMLTMGESLPAATPRRYYFSVNLAGLPAGRRISFGFLQPAHFQVTGHDATFPMQSAPMVVRYKVYANPVNGVANYAFPVGGSTRSGGVDTGLFVRPGQRLVVTSIAGDTWSVPGSTSAAGDASAPGNLASLPTGALVARIGGGSWFFVGPTITSASSTKTVTATGQVYLAPEDASAYGDNSGFIRAALDVLPSTSPKIWTGGTLGFEKQADIDQNWIGGYPRPGERAVFDSSAYDCDWNIPFATLSQLDVSTAYVKTITLLPPQFHQNNSLVVTGDATIGGGRLELNKSSSTFQVQGRLIVQTSATLSMGGFISIGAGAEFRSGSFWRNDDYANVSRAFPGNSYYLRVVGATVAVAGQTQVDGMLSIDFTSTTFSQLDRIQFNNYPTASTIPLVSFANGNPVSYTFRDWSSVPPARVSSGVFAGAMHSGSTITFLNSAHLTGTSFGSPHTSGPPGVVKWIPDGGGSMGQIDGALTAPNGAQYRILASTSPVGVNTIQGMSTTRSGSGAFSIVGLRAPSTYYVFAYEDPPAGPGVPDQHARRSGYLHQGYYRSEPVFVPSGVTVSPYNVTVEEWGAVQGLVTNLSKQLGPTIVETWDGAPQLAASTRVAAGLAAPAYLFQTRSSFSGVMHSSQVFVYVDVNRNAQWDPFESSNVFVGADVPAQSTASITAITLTGGDPAPGPSVTLSSSAIHFGGIASEGPQPLIRFRLTPTGPTGLSALRLRFEGSLPAVAAIPHVWRDNGDGQFNPKLDALIGQGSFNTTSPTTTIVFPQVSQLPPGSPSDFFVTMELFGTGLQQAGVLVDAATNFALTAGTFTVTNPFPAGTGPLNVYTLVRASEPANANLTGGAVTTLFAYQGQTINFTSLGQWKTGPGDALTNANGASGTTGLDTILPSANRGELIGRLQGGANGSSQWFRIGVSTSIPAPQTGGLVLAMNDFVNAHYDNEGAMLVDYNVTGSTLGSIAGQIFYSTPVAGTLTVSARLNGQTISAQTNFGVAASSSYPFAITGLNPGSYDVFAQNSANGDFGVSVTNVDVVAGATSYLDATMFNASGTITGTIAYVGQLANGDFRVGVTTTTDLSGDVNFFGRVTTPTAGAYALGDLPTPATYFLVAFRDGNGSGAPEGPEPFGYYGIPGGGISTLPSFSSGIFVAAGTTVTAINVTLQDMGAIEGKALLTAGATGTLVVEVGRGVPGIAGYVTENRIKVPMPAGGAPAGGIEYRLGLLRPATGYSLFAFRDANGDDLPSGGEEQATVVAQINVPSGGRARRDVPLTSIVAPATPAEFTAAAAANQVRFEWNLVPGATGYQLRRQDLTIFAALGGSASFYIDSLADNTSSQIRSITASNLNGVSAGKALAGPVYSLASVPSGLGVTGVTALSATNTWGGTNPAGTQYELVRATSAASPSAARVFLGTASSFVNSLAPASTYYWAVRAINGNGVVTAFSTDTSTVTPTVAGPSLAGVITYAGGQTSVAGRRIVVEVSTVPVTFTPLAASGTLAGFPQQPWYLGVPAGSHYMRAFVDVAGTGVIHPGSDRGTFGPTTVAASSVTGQDFAITVDTVPPAAPAGVVAAPGFGKVTLTWAAPTKRQDGAPLVDLAAYAVERATAATAAFQTLATALSTTSASYVDNFPLPGLPSFYRVRALDFGGNQSAPSGAVSGTPSAGGSISGRIREFSVAGSGQYRVRLTTVPAVTAPSVAEAIFATYTFTGLVDGVYYLRAFRDTDGNGAHNPVNEAAGTFGGLNAPFPIAVVNGNAVTGADATICDRQALTLPSSTGSLNAAGCPALDKGPGFVTSLFAIPVGGGAAGSFGVGSQINVAVSTDTTFATEIIALAPDGSVAGRDNRVGGANLTFTLSQPGVYLVEPTSFLSGQTGSFSLKSRLEGGFAGTISATVTYSGGRPGLVHTQLFTAGSASANGQNAPPLVTSTAASPGNTVFAGLPDGQYTIRAYRDANGNGVRDAGEPNGAFGPSLSSPTVILVSGGFAQGGPFVIPIKDPAAGAVNGVALYDGTGSAALRVVLSRSNCTGSFCGDGTVAFTTIAAGAPFLLSFIPPATDYFLNAIVDVNGNGRQDPLEPAVSSFPVTVTANSTTTVSMVARDSGGGFAGEAIVAGTITYAGASTGPIFVGLSRDPSFRSIDYLLQLPTTGYFEKTGLQGNSTYYLASFIDTNLNNNPDEHLGEPTAAGTNALDFSTPSFINPPPIYVPQTGTKFVKLDIYDQPNGRIEGVVEYAGAASAPNIVVTPHLQMGANGGQPPPSVVIPRVPGVSTYAFTLTYLPAGAYFVNAFIDANGNNQGDFGEPSGGLNQIDLSTGAGAFPRYGADVTIFDPGAFGAAQTAGRVRSEMVYLGTQSGPIFVRFFGNEERLGTPLYTVRIPASGNPPAGSGEFALDKQNLPFGTYWLDAFRDPSGAGVYNPAAHAHGVLNAGAAVEVTPERPSQYAFSGTISDPGQGGSVNAYTGHFAHPGGARFDGGATDLGAMVAVDPYSGPSHNVIALGVTNQNEGTVVLGVRYSSAGVMLSNGVVNASEELSIGGLTPDDSGNVFLPGRMESPNAFGPGSSTATITVFDGSWSEINYGEFPDYQGFDGLGFSPATSMLYAGSRYQINNEIRGLKIDPSTLATATTWTFTSPGGCANCNSRVLGSAVSPDGQIFLVYGVANQQGEDDRGLHFLIKFNGSQTGGPYGPVASRDVTSLGAQHRGPGVGLVVSNAGEAYLTFVSSQTARIVKFDVSGAVITQQASASYSPIVTHFGGGLGNTQIEPASGHVFTVWESTTNGGDYMLLRHDQSLNLVGQRFFDGGDGTREDSALSLSIFDSSNVYVGGAVDSGLNLDMTFVRMNGNGSGSSGGAGVGVVITTSNAVSYIAGSASYGGALASSGTVRMALIPIYDDVPVRFATAPFGASSPFLFNNVPDGIYDIRSFIDMNGSLSPDEGEPLGASTLFGIEFAAEESQTLADPVQMCDRRQIAFGVDVLQSFTAADCTSPDRPGAPRRLYTFRGTRGQPVTILLRALGFYDSYMDLYGPDGDWLEYDDDSAGDGDAIIENYVLPEDGVYTIDAGAYASGSLGLFRLSLTGSDGSLGSIKGRVDYAGSQGGSVVVGLFNAPTFSTATTVGRLALASTRAFSFDSLRVGATYYLGAFIDVNSNNAPDAGEDSGVFGSTSSPTGVRLSPGQTVTGVEIAVIPSTASAASAAYMTGLASYSGARTGPLMLEFWSSAQFVGRPVVSRVVPTGAGTYDVAVPGGLPYYVRAFVDANSDFALQPDEPRGVYSPTGLGADRVYAPAGQTVVGVDIAMKDPGTTASGAIAGGGTAVLNSTSVVAGELSTIIVTYTAAASTIGTNGQIGFTAPTGFPFPNAFSSVTVTSPFTAVTAVSYNGPSAFVTVTGAGLDEGETVTFEWSNVYVPCQVGAATITVSAVQNGTAAPQPLFLGSPSLSIVNGAAEYVALDENYFSIKAGELSEVRRIVSYSRCGQKSPLAAPGTITLNARKYDAGSFVSDPEVGVTTSVVQSTAASLSIDFAAGQSSAPFYVHSVSTGFKYLEIHSPLGGALGTTFYFGVNAVPANALTAVSVSTASGGVALSSASIGLAANGQPNQVFINFTLGDPQQPWHVLISSLPFKSGERPNAVWERWGFGQPNSGEIAWDARFSPWINGGGRVPNGLYYARVELGGGGVKDDAIRLTVNLPQFAGRSFDPGVIPNPPLTGVQLRVYGPSGYYTAETAADGSYVLPGLGAGNYRVNVGRPDYVDGAVDMTLNASGAATSFTPRTPGVLVSSNATGGLDFYISRAPRLIVVPSLDASIGAQAVDQWGNLQVRPSTSIFASTFYGPMRLKAGTTTFDDGGQWDPGTQQFVTRTLLGFNVPVGTYTVLADLAGFSRSTAAVYVGPDGARVDLAPFVRKTLVTGQVFIPGNTENRSVSVVATPLSTGAVTPGFGSVFLAAGTTSALYTIGGLDAGAYIFRANTQGLSAAATGPILLPSSGTVAQLDFPAFGPGASITGVITIGGGAPNGTRVYVNAWSPGSFNFGSTTVYTSGGAASYALNGLDSGATYQLYANVDIDGDYDVAGGFPRKLNPTVVDSFTLVPASGVVSGTILLPAGATNFVDVTLHGLTVASNRPERVGKSFVEISTSLPNFLCGNGAVPTAPGYCAAGVSSATFKVQGLNTETLEIRFLHSTTGQSSRQLLSIVNGSTSTLIADLSAATHSISGFLVNQITDSLFNTNAKILANAPYIAPSGYPVGLSSTTARVTAIRQEIDSFGVAISTRFDPLTSRVGFLDAAGAFTIPNVPNGVWLVRTQDLRSCATCAIIAPAAGRVVSVAGAAVSSVTLTVSNGYNVSGTISLDGGLQDARVFDISVYNRRQELVRSTQAYLGDLSAGAVAGSVDYSFANLPAGEFYTLVVRGLLFPIKYVGRPIKFPDPALSPSGLQSHLVRQDVTMQRASYIVGRLKDGITGELVSATNATLLAPNFAITATANPWTEGGFVVAAASVSGRPVEADGYFRVGPLLPNVSYDLRLAQSAWDPNFLASGSQNYAPVTIAGLKPTPGEIKDVGVVSLGQGQSITGLVKSTTTGLGLGGIKVVAKPSYGGEDLEVQSFTTQQGAYSIWVSSAVSNQFTLTAAPRDGNRASDGLYYGQVTLTNVNLQTQTSANFLLTPLTVVVTGQVVVADAAQGGALSYPFGDKRGFPAAAINLRPSGVVTDNPLGDIEATTDERGFFSVPGLSTGLYHLHATSLGYAVYNATVSVAGSTFRIFLGSDTVTNDVPGKILTLARGATATGRILKSDGSAPNSTEVVGVAAANFGADEFVVGSVETDPVAKTVNAYTISGFKPGIPYNIVLLSGRSGKEVSFPPEGAGVLFTAVDSTTTKTINLTYRPAALDCLATAKALDAARSQFSIQVDCLKPLRQETAADDDLTAILAVSTFTQSGAALTAPNGTGSLSGRLLSADRRRLTATYAIGVSETRFTMRVRAKASEVDPRTGDSFEIDKVFDFYAGLDAHADGRVTNIDGGQVVMQPSAQDELLGVDERSRIDLPPGAFGEGSDSLPDSSVVAQPTTTVNVSMTKGRDQTLARALSIATRGYAPAALQLPDNPSSYPGEMWAAMSAYRTQASTTQVGGANPLSAFYSIFLPAGIRHQLKERADLTLSYQSFISTATSNDDVNVWFYNAVLGRFTLESTNRRLDPVAKTITVSVDHFSTFVVLDSTPVATSTVTFGGPEIAAANFPNPADCITHSNIARNAFLFGSGGVHQPFVGTMIRYSIPPGGAAPLKINIYNVAGEKVRTIDQGELPAGQTYYTPWNCANDAGKTVASGVYIGEVVHGGRRRFFKMAIIKGSGL